MWMSWKQNGRIYGEISKPFFCNRTCILWPVFPTDIEKLEITPKLIYNTKTPTMDVCRKIYRIKCKGYTGIDIGYSVVWVAADSQITDLQAEKKVTFIYWLDHLTHMVSCCLSAQWGLEGRSFCIWLDYKVGFPGGASGKVSDCQCRRCKRCGFHPWMGKIPWRRAWFPTQVFLSGVPWTKETGRLHRVHRTVQSQTRLKRLSTEARRL